MANRFSVEAVFKGIDKVSAPVKRMGQRVSRFTRRAGKQVSRLRGEFRGLRKGVKSFALGATVAFGLIAAAGADVIRTGIDFEQSIVNATVKVGGLDQQSQKFIDTQQLLTAEARRLGRTTEFTATQAANGLNTLVMAGFSAEQAVASLGGVLDLATIAQIDMAEAADVATGALGSFNLKADDAQTLAKNLARVNDVLAKTTITSKNTMFDLSEALKDGGPSAKAVGADIETFAAIAGRMADGNIRATKAGTTMKNMFLRLAKPAADAQKLFKRWNITTTDADGNLRDVIDILGDLERQLGTLGTGQRAAAIETIFGKRAIAGVSVLLEKGTKDLRAYRDTLSDVSGESSKMANITRNTVGGSLKALLSSIESVKLSIFGANKGELKDIIDNMTKWVRANESLIAADVGKVVKGLIDKKEGIMIVGRAFGFIVERILKGVEALGEMKGLIEDLMKIQITETGASAEDLIVSLFRDIEGQAKPVGLSSLGTIEAKRQVISARQEERQRRNADRDELNRQVEVHRTMSPEMRLFAEAFGKASFGKGEVTITTAEGVEAKVEKEDPNLKLNVSPTGAD